jgi:tetratricopeptide (TPR) repeat protein
VETLSRDISERLRGDGDLAHLNRGQALSERGSVDRAISEIREAIRQDPGSAAAHNALGVALRRKGRSEDAVTAYREALRIDPDRAVTYHNLAVVLQALGRVDEAIACSREAIRRLPSLDDARLNLATALNERGNNEEAVAVLRELVRHSPDDYRAYSNLGLALCSLGRFDEAIAACREALRLKPNLARTHSILGRIYRFQGLLDQALAATREAIRHDPGLVDAHHQLGMLLLRKGEFQEALEAFRRCAELDPKMAAWWKICERLAALEPRVPALLAGEERPADAAERADLAQFCYFLGRYHRSARLFREAFAEEPSLSEDSRLGRRSFAGCAAARAGCGHGETPPSGVQERAEWRRKALLCLQAELQGYRDRIGAEGQRVRAFLQAWLLEPDLACVRNEDALAKLPEAEREAWRAFWRDVRAAIEETWEGR